MALAAEIFFAIHNVFLPSKLPQSGDDSRSTSHEAALLDIIIKALEKFSSFVDPAHKGGIELARQAISSFDKLRDDSGFIIEEELMNVLNRLASEDMILPLHVNAQNAGIIITRNSNSILFESFELSPKNETVMGTKGRLRRSFPASSISIPLENYRDDGFISALAHAIANMSHQEVAEAKPKIVKKGEHHIEDTTDPFLVTDFLHTILQTVGKSTEPSIIWKNTRDEVLRDNAKTPWRRSPVWLLIRVTLQMCLDRLESRRRLYKEFMVVLLSDILKMALEQEFQADYLYCMIAKIERRLIKLREDIECPCRWLPIVHRTLEKTWDDLKQRWDDISRKADPQLKLDDLSTPISVGDVFEPYPALDEFLNNIERRQKETTTTQFRAPWVAPRFESGIIPALEGTHHEEVTFNLLAFEEWVKSSLYDWTSSRLADEKTCESLSTAMLSYYRQADTYYRESPESLSVMLLTVLDLWIACDRSACKRNNLLLKYSPGIPRKLLQSLLLNSKEHLERLVKVEAYLEKRNNDSLYGPDLVFSSFGNKDSFSVRYYATSEEHRTLREKMEATAAQERENKKSEFSRKKLEYNDLMSLSNQLDCSYAVSTNRWGILEYKHKSCCYKCSLKNGAEAMTILVHEWPLPSEEWKSQSTVFELAVPRCFNAWRNATILISHDVLGCQYSTPERVECEENLSSYLSHDYSNVGYRRLELFSTTKSHYSTHRSGKDVSISTEEDVLVHNGLRYEFYDVKKVCFVSSAEPTDMIPRVCMYKLSQQNQSLQEFVFRPSWKENGLSPNHVLSQQFSCPEKLSLEEFKAMAMLPFGYRIQWSNVLVQLFNPTVDFSKPDTVLILSQIIHQAGPPLSSSVYRAGHQQLQEKEFVDKLIHGLSRQLEIIKDNWESYMSLKIFISIAIKALNLAPSGHLVTKCCSFLEGCRTVAIKWIDLLQDKVSKTDDEAQRVEIFLITSQISLICIASFDIEQFVLETLLSDEVQIKTLIKCTAIIKSLSHNVGEQLNPIHIGLTLQAKRVLYKAHRILIREIIETRNQGLDNAVKSILTSYTLRNEWHTLSSTEYHWLETRATENDGEDSLAIQINLLNGELLVNGLPPSRLPEEYERHPSFNTLFKRSIIKVLPTRNHGMRFKTMKAYKGYDLSFGMDKSASGDLLLVASKGLHNLELIPPRVFEQILPASFIDNYVHWYDHLSGNIEFRPKELPWTYSDTNWFLNKVGSSWILKKQAESLLGPRSFIARRICEILSPLEDKTHIHLAVNNDSTVVKVDLPRLLLEFSLQPESSKLFCRQFRGMYVDGVQGIGTLIGLDSKLTLRDDQNNRKVLVPNGRVIYSSFSQHVRVRIEYGSSTRIHTYGIDTRLGRLVDNGSLASKLTLAYLHGVTSFCLPDKLTCKTGTEGCLSIVNSASVRSFQNFSKEDLDILDSISTLSPGREYYHKHEHVMEKTHWDDNLSFLSQHGGLHASVKSIFDEVNSTKFFHGETFIEPPILDRVNPDLEQRYQIRASTFNVSEFGAENYTTSYDIIYQGRDRVSRPERSRNAFAIATMMVERREALHAPMPNDFSDMLWDLLKSSDGTKGPNEALRGVEISYDSKWLSQTQPMLRSIWCRFHRTYGSGSTQFCRFRLMFCLAAMAYSEDCHFSSIQALAACANIASIGRIEVPSINVFQMLKGYRLNESDLESVIRRHSVEFVNSTEAQLVQYHYETDQDLQRRRARWFKENQEAAISDLMASFRKQWVCNVPATPAESHFDKYYDKIKIAEAIRPTWLNWYENQQLFEYLKVVANALQSVEVEPIPTPAGAYVSRTPLPYSVIKRRYINDEGLFDRHPPTLNNISEHHQDLLDTKSMKQDGSGSLDELVGFLRLKASQDFEHRYLEDLNASRMCNGNYQDQPVLTKTGNDLRQTLQLHFKRCVTNSESIYDKLTKAVGSSEPLGTSTLTSYMVPRISPSFFLGQLSRTRWHRLSSEWKQAIVTYAISLTMIQRAERMLHQQGDRAELINELSNLGHTNWDPMDYPDSLLLEVESGILIRKVQEEIAGNMRNPPGNENTVMQLNMGEGKSSVIVPIVAAHLADGKRLVRVLVAKPQAKELLRMLISKLGGLMNRQVYHMPFSRSLRLSASDADTVFKLSKKCAENGGILLMQPEHLLSFQLMGIESQLNSQEKVGQVLFNTQHYFNTCSRDIVDESDENFNVKFELIYTMGTQRPIELSFERWNVIQRVLGVVKDKADMVQRELPESVEVEIVHFADNQFPRTRLLREDAENMLLEMIAKDICETGFPGFPIHRQPIWVRESVCKYILHEDLSIEDIEDVEIRSGFFQESIKGFLFLMRSLLAEGVLGFALRQKRWRVNYGPAFDRNPKTRLAVPYRAKDSPTTRSEFSHPDIVIVLTCLSYYYEGLSDDDLYTSFEHLKMADQAEVEYQDWVRDAPKLSQSFRTLKGVTMKDYQQMTREIFPHFRRAKRTIDYFLSHIVFSKEMKEFPQKLTASGWDIGRKKSHPTTGFSGTCDSSELLPLDIKHLDLPSQRHTNAMVIENILRQENSVVRTKCSDAYTFLDLVSSLEPSVQVILDVGAQIIELTNSQLAEAWLERIPEDQEKEAVIFFDDHDDIFVVDRQGRREKLQTSPYSQQLHLCLVFLDQAHTRGTDLKLPKYYRAAVTLGPGLTKDRLVQACMRMRKLGQDQSVIFCVSEEIESKINSLKDTTDNRDIHVSDVLAWAICETFTDLRRSIPLWAMQGQRFETHRRIWDRATNNDTILMSSEEAGHFLEEEAQSLEHRYRPKGPGSGEQSEHFNIPQQGESPQLDKIRQRCSEFGIAHLRASILSEEQERELSPEMVQERQIERPPPVDPKDHRLHPNVRKLVSSGILQNSSPFFPAFDSLRNTSAAQELDVSCFPDDVLVTEDFKQTVKLVGHHASADFYQRSVQWILSKISSSGNVTNIIIISPYEAQELMPMIAASQHVHLHLYAPLLRLVYKPLDDLHLYITPKLQKPWHLHTRQRLLLNLFAGQLYFRSYDDYVETCKLLDLSSKPTEGDDIVEPDGFIVSGHSKATTIVRSPIPFLRAFLMAIRRNSDGNDKTHWGRILGGEILKKEELDKNTELDRQALSLRLKGAIVG